MQANWEAESAGQRESIYRAKHSWQQDVERLGCDVEGWGGAWNKGVHVCCVCGSEGTRHRRALLHVAYSQ